MREIQDTEIRVIGDDGQKPQRKKRAHLAMLLTAAVLVLLGVAVMWYVNKAMYSPAPEEGVYDPQPAQQLMQPQPLKGWVDSLNMLKTRGTALKDTMVNDIPLRLYAPLNAMPHLEVGYQCLSEREKHVLFFQAADIRGDNGGIVGAFVLKGEPLSRGLSKRGYCAIIGNTVSIGVADNSPLFEAATEENGDFFRQYPLVDNGQLIENETKNKSVRKGLCMVNGRVVVAETLSRESLHDFAEALVDLGVENAIYLVGGDVAIGWCRPLQGEGVELGNWKKRLYKNANFIVWD